MLRHIIPLLVLLLPMVGVAQVVDIATADSTLSAMTDSLDGVLTDSLTTALTDNLDDVLHFDEALPQYGAADSLDAHEGLAAFDEDSLATAYARQLQMEYRDSYFERFNPKPDKAVWMAALFPGGGQIYNRKYWKLPIIYGGFLGLIYGYNWNQRYYRTYSNAYREIMLGSANPTYLNLLRGGTMEQRRKYAEQHKDYLTGAFQRKKNIYRNYRDYCVVGMLAVYLVSIVDAYVDAALYHFDVSPELSADNTPAVTLHYTLEF